MLVRYNNKNFRVDFFYSADTKYGQVVNDERKEENLIGNKVFLNSENTLAKNRKIKTIAIISEKIGDKQYKDLSADFVVRNTSDPINKRLGQQLALQKALYQIKDLDLQKAIWDAFFNIKSRIVFDKDKAVFERSGNTVYISVFGDTIRFDPAEVKRIKRFLNKSRRA